MGQHCCLTAHYMPPAPGLLHTRFIRRMKSQSMPDCPHGFLGIGDCDPIDLTGNWTLTDTSRTGIDWLVSVQIAVQFETTQTCETTATTQTKLNYNVAPHGSVIYLLHHRLRHLSAAPPAASSVCCTTGSVIYLLHHRQRPNRKLSGGRVGEFFL